MYGKAIVFTSCRLLAVASTGNDYDERKKRCLRQEEAAFSDLSKISIAGLFRME